MGQPMHEWLPALTPGSVENIFQNGGRKEWDSYVVGDAWNSGSYIQFISGVFNEWSGEKRGETQTAVQLITYVCVPES